MSAARAPAAHPTSRVPRRPEQRATGAMLCAIATPEQRWRQRWRRESGNNWIYRTPGMVEPAFTSYSRSSSESACPGPSWMAMFAASPIRVIAASASTRERW